jgi:glycosyltransferase involved in cell wall biosynthesis
MPLAVGQQSDHARQRRRGPVPRRERPGNAELGVVESDGHILARVVGTVDTVRDVRRCGQSLEPVGVPGGDVQRHLLVVAQLETLPVTVGGGAGAHVYDHVEDNPVGATYKLRLAVAAPDVQPAHDSLDRTRDAILREAVRIHPGSSHYVGIEGPAEEAPLIQVRCRFEQQHTAKLCCLPDFQAYSVHYAPRYCTCHPHPGRDLWYSRGYAARWLGQEGPSILGSPFDSKRQMKRAAKALSGNDQGAPAMNSSAPAREGPHPRLTIGLPVYNGENYLAECLEALLGQTYEDFELLISDNASTDATADICLSYAKRDPRIRYVRQPRNIGLVPNYNFLVDQATGEFFKPACHDDLYARDLLKCCIEALDADPQVALAHSWSAAIDGSGAVLGLLDYHPGKDASRAVDRLRAILFDTTGSWGEDTGGVIRTDVLRRVPRHDSYHFAERAYIASLALHGTFYMVPNWMYFRRRHPGQSSRVSTVRARCAKLDPRRAKRLRHPALRLYGEYILGYVNVIRSSPLSPAERRKCYLVLAHWFASRVLPVTGRALSRSGLQVPDALSAQAPPPSIDALVAGR